MVASEVQAQPSDAIDDRNCASSFKPVQKRELFRYSRGLPSTLASDCIEQEQDGAMRSSFAAPRGSSFDGEMLYSRYSERRVREVAVRRRGSADPVADRAGYSSTMQNTSSGAAFVVSSDILRPELAIHSSVEARDDSWSRPSTFLTRESTSETTRSAPPSFYFGERIGDEQLYFQYPRFPRALSPVSSKSTSFIRGPRQNICASVGASPKISDEAEEQAYCGDSTTWERQGASATDPDRSSSFATTKSATDGEYSSPVCAKATKGRTSVSTKSTLATENSRETENVKPSVKRNYTGGKKGRKRKRGYIYNPKPMKSKVKSTIVPDDLKDTEYYENRRRNNEAANISRQRRRMKELEMVNELDRLRAEKARLAERNKDLEKIVVLHAHVCSLRKDCEGLAPLLSSLDLLPPALNQNESAPTVHGSANKPTDEELVVD